MTKNKQELFAVARAAMENAHAPYSFYRVGAAVRGGSGKIYGGTNVENASYPEGWCAETSAIGALITAGEKTITEICVLGGGETPATPCGGCRQRLSEFASPQTPVYVGTKHGLSGSYSMADLLPEAFKLKSEEDDLL